MMVISLAIKKVSKPTVPPAPEILSARGQHLKVAFIQPVSGQWKKTALCSPVEVNAHSAPAGRCIDVTNVCEVHKINEALGSS